MTQDRGIRFEEVQRVRQPWVWILTFVGSGVALSVALCGPYQQLVLGEPFGTNPLSDRGLIALSVVMAVIALAVPLLVGTLRLEVRVGEAVVDVRFVPLMRRRLPLASIERAEACEYRPIAHYGGWGVRWSLIGRGWAYTMSGRHGVQLDLSNGKRLLIGSHRPAELAEAIRAAKMSA